MLMRAEAIARSFGRNRVLRNVTFAVQAGESVGIAGENGSGKSTLLNVLAGLLAPDRGQVAIACSWGHCPQEMVLFDSLTVAEHFAYFAAAYRLDRAGWHGEMERLLDTFAFRRYARERVEALSGGTKQKLSLSLSLLHRPRLLILDEPYANLDWETYMRFWDFAAAAKREGRSLLIVSHFFYDRAKLDRLFVLRNGALACLDS